MPNIVKKLARASLTASEETLYTVPSATTAVVTNIVVTNTTSSAITCTVKLDTVDVLSATSVSGNGILALDIKQVIGAAETISALASDTGLRIHISGMEIS